MDLLTWIPVILVGMVAGWLGSLLFKGAGSGLIKNILLGVAGAVVGNQLFTWLDISVDGLKGDILSATIGAFVILWIFRLIFGSPGR